ncbi:large conductance mechanosensitive channel protein MscL [Suttonella sp. R2A3]|uniref:large conductance mechanosensitive channel protein MscL n=1 Tax=Suttonella sp. R2A3 TaxID=2908648 RepID=UPI001F2F7024|nr:large conductance mechanosensitive channel protein MscL [Suttonella sp. R2A3]UJF23949.1 large conductance mechanosensitive channel protein MscL [Suttonella sp. R2A3]
MFKGFKEFISRGNAIDLAVGVVIGAAFGAVVTGLVETFINPLISVIAGEPNFDDIGFTLNGVLFPIGQIITALVNFLLVAFAIYFFIVMPMNKLNARMKKEEEAEEAPAEPSEEVVLLREIRDQLAKSDKV